MLHLEKYELFTVEKVGNGPQLCGTAAYACAFNKNGVIGYPFSSDSKPVAFKPRRGHPVIFWSTKMDAGWLRTSKVSDAYFEEHNKTWTIITANSIYKARLAQDESTVLF